MGESMGGASSIYFALKEPELVKGVIAFCPGIKPNVFCYSELQLEDSPDIEVVKQIPDKLEELGTYECNYFQVDNISKHLLDLGTLGEDKLLYQGKTR